MERAATPATTRRRNPLSKRGFPAIFPGLKTKKAPTPDLTLLGRSAPFPTEPSAAILETFPNRNPGRNYRITFDCQEFTSLCPVTGQPDYAKFQIHYIPADLCIETKSLKYYLASFRQTRAFNEAIANRILDDLVSACRPRWVHVHGEFSPRGGVRVVVDVEHPDPSLPSAPTGRRGSASRA